MRRAVIFDFDGTILDTETPEFHAWQEVYRHHGAELALEDWLPCIGTGSVFDPHAHLETLAGVTLDREDVALLRGTLHEERLAAETLRPGVARLIAQARSLGWRIGLASSSSRAWVEPHLEKLGIRDAFETLQTRDLVAQVKPDPALYRQAIVALGVPGGQAIAIEDSVNGMRAAQAAGIFTVVVPNAITRHMDFAGADLVVDSLEGLDLASLAAPGAR